MQVGRFGYFLGAVVVVLVAVLGLASLVHYEVGMPGIGERPQITCPFDNDPYVWTPIWSENTRWICLRTGRTWDKSYPAGVYQQWRKASLQPEYVRDYTILYLRQIEGKALPEPLTATWTGRMERAELGNDTYIYEAQGILVKIEYPRAASDNMQYTITVQTEEGIIIWQGLLFQRQFITRCLPCKITP